MLSDGTDNDDNHQSNEADTPQHVELATLSLPAVAVTYGLIVGDGQQVVLEAASETVEQINSNTNDTMMQTISGIVDLEILSELVGAIEEDFIAGLHRDVQKQREEDADEEEADADGPPNETTPLIPPIPEDEVADQVILLADPFIESLAEVLPSVVASEDGHDQQEEEDEETANDHFTEAAATTAGTDQRLAHDAFLLNIPVTDDEGNMENHYVLALPEIQVEDSLMTEASMGSGAPPPILERALSLLPTTTRLPTDIQGVHLEATEHIPDKEDPTTVHLDIVVDRKVPIIGYVILFSGLFALASVGAALDLQQGPTPSMKTLWRQIATSIALIPMVLKSVYYDGVPILKGSDLLLLPAAATMYTYMTLAFVLSLDYTTLANAFVLSNMTSLVIIAGRSILGLPVLPSEGIGALTGFFGAAVCADDAGHSENLTAGNAMLGNLIALSASFGTAGYLLIAKSLRDKMDLFVFMFCIMTTGAFVLLAFLVIRNEETVTFDMHQDHGVFGWLNPESDRLPLEIYMAVICNCLGTTGYVAVMKYFQPLVPATVMLLEPVVGALLGTAAGTAPLPGLQTWLGDLVVAGGTLLVIQAGAKKTENIDATEALRSNTAEGLQSPSLRNGPPSFLRRDTTVTLSGQSVTSRSASKSTGQRSRPKIIWET